MNNDKAEISRLNGIIKSLKQENAELQARIKNYKAKEQSVSSAIIFALERSNQLEDSRRKLYELDIQRSRVLFIHMENVLNSMYAKYPELQKETKLRDMTKKFKASAYPTASSTYGTQPKKTYPSGDPIRKLLNNIINYIDDKPEVKIMQRQEGVGAGLTAMQEYANTPSTSGFDINEALHPTESLDEILRSFNLNK